MASASYDVAIVGAGAAGLGALRAARDLGLSAIALEAMDRIGGRAWTDVATFGHGWDLGCHWLHSADVNPFRELADAYGLRYRGAPSAWRVWNGGRWATDADLAAIDVYIDDSVARAKAAAAAGRDVPLSEVIDRGSPWVDAYRGVVHAEWGVEIDRASTFDVARYRDTDRNWPVEDGYGALVARHARGLPVELSTPVRRVDWSGPRVRLETDKGTIEAGAVVITASTTLLADGGIEFSPALPAWKQEAFAAVPLGSANKVGIAIDGERLEVDDYTSVSVRLDAERAMSFQLRPFGRDFANAYLAGPFSRELEREGPEAMTAAAIEGLVALYGSDIRRHVRTTAATAWGREPCVRGGYAAATPGQAGRRANLNAPVADRLFFAGEAGHPEFFSTCHGAHLSGIAAAEAAALALGATRS